MTKNRRYLPYNKDLKKFSRNLRNDSTFSEILLWMELRAGKMKGYKFNRQKPILNYIVDFYCKKLRLVIEIDGISHDYEEVAKKDKIRQAKLEEIGLQFIRFDDLEVKTNMENVLSEIEGWIEDWEQKNKEGNPTSSIEINDDFNNSQ
jgi:very-short-patch-repair endonuclease